MAVNVVERVRFGVDSGAALTVVSENFGMDYSIIPRSGPRRCLRSATGEAIPEKGDRHLMVRCPTAETQNVIRSTVAGVAKNLLAVVDLVDAGHEVKFSREDSYIKNENPGQKIQMVRNQRNYEVEFEVVPYTEAQAQISKSGNGLGPRKE